MANKEIAFAFEYEGRVIQLPITPEEIEITYPGNNKSADVILLGEINLLKTRKLATFTIKSWFPDEDWYPGIRTTGRFRKSSYYVKFFEKIRDAKKPCDFYIYGLNFNMRVSIETFTHQRKGGEHEDLYYTLALKEYRPFSVRELPQIVQEESEEILETLDKKTPVLEPTEITIGTTVVVNGTLHGDSYGGNPGKTLNNYTGRVSLINKKGSHPYHIINTSGGWLGWVNDKALTISSEQISGLPMASRPKQTTTTTHIASSRMKHDGGGRKFTIQEVANSKGKEKINSMNQLLTTYKGLVNTYLLNRN